MKKVFFLLLFPLLLPGIAIAAPSISGVSGSLSHSSSITVSGSGFGTKAQAAPDLWDTVENKYHLSDGAAIPTGGSYPWGEQDSVTYETSDLQRGKSTAFYKGVRATVGDRAVPDATKLYLAWWERSNMDLAYDAHNRPPDCQIEGCGHSSKYLRLNGANYHYDPGRQTISWTQLQFYVYDNAGIINLWPEVYLTPVNTWHFLEVYADQNSRIYQVSVDGDIVASSNSNSGAAWDWDYVWRLGFDAGGNDPPSPIISIDDIYVDSTQSRVMVCAGLTWANRGHCEIQVPQAVWNNTNVMFTFNQGSFPDNQTAYLYVVDSNGAVNTTGY